MIRNLTAVALAVLVVVGALPTGVVGAAATGQASVMVTTDTADGTLTVDVRITNRGDTDASYEVDLATDGETVASRDVRVPMDGARRVVFERPVPDGGTYSVYVNDVLVEEFTPTATATTTERAATSSTVPSLTLAVGAGLLLLGGLVLLRRR
ncbi:hypothetical protein BRD04_08980 [Halobacteriales archaeon QS_9_67_17]|nr:MAG: hypothetical protein BRD04_08980 [Halobacteriales archaeon QS_9_67_17]